MESVAYILVLAGALGTLFFAIAFREPPKIQDDEQVIVANCLSPLWVEFWANCPELFVFRDIGLGNFYKIKGMIFFAKLKLFCTLFSLLGLIYG